MGFANPDHYSNSQKIFLLNLSRDLGKQIPRVGTEGEQHFGLSLCLPWVTWLLFSLTLSDMQCLCSHVLQNIWSFPNILLLFSFWVCAVSRCLQRRGICAGIAHSPVQRLYTLTDFVLPCKCFFFTLQMHLLNVSAEHICLFLELHRWISFFIWKFCLGGRSRISP